VPATKDANYRGGIPESICPILMDPWQPPTTKAPIVTLPQRLVLDGTGGMDATYTGLPGSLGLTGLPLTVFMDAAGKVSVPVTTPPNPRGWKITVTPATGAFSGSHTALDGTKSVTVNFSGVLRQPAASEAPGALIGGGFGIVPQLTGQTAGTLGSGILFEQVVATPE